MEDIDAIAQLPSPIKLHWKGFTFGGSPLDLTDLVSPTRKIHTVPLARVSGPESFRRTVKRPLRCPRVSTIEDASSLVTAFFKGLGWIIC